MSGYTYPSIRLGYQREARLVTRIRKLELRNAMLREALEGMVEAYPIKDIGWLKACECPMCQSYKDGKAALEEEKHGDE